MRNGLDDLPERNVIISHISCGCAFSSSNAKGVVIGQTNNLQTRHIPLVFKSFEFRDKTLRALHVVKVEIKSAIAFIDMALQTFHLGGRRLGWSRKQYDKLSIAAITDPCLLRAIP